MIKKQILVLLIFLIACFLTSCNEGGSSPISPNVRVKNVMNSYSLSVNGTTFNGVITGNNIYVTVPDKTDISSMIATFKTANPNSSVTVNNIVQDSGVTVNNFMYPLDYKVSSNVSEANYYKVTVIEISDVPARFISFSIDGVNGIINSKSVWVRFLSQGLETKNLVATFVTSNPKDVVTVDGVIQNSGITKNDFSQPLRYKISAPDGNVAYYEVLVTLNKTYFIPYSPSNCIVNNRDFGIVGTCSCIQDPNTHDIWYTKPYHTESDWSAVNTWATSLKVCGFSSGWNTPSATQFGDLINYINSSNYQLVVYPGTWLNNNGFDDINVIGTYWGNSSSLGMSLFGVTIGNDYESGNLYGGIAVHSSN